MCFRRRRNPCPTRQTTADEGDAMLPSPPRKRREGQAALDESSSLAVEDHDDFSFLRQTTNTELTAAPEGGACSR
jgi:hypothetical protein